MTAVSTRHTTSETSATTREVASIELSDQTASASGEDLLGDDADDGAAVAEFDTDAVAARSTTLETSLPYCRATGEDVSTIASSAGTVASERAGRHSRSCKDLVNLNKAAVQWLQQQKSGTLALHEVVDRISASVVARHLAAAHGEQYDESRFVNAVMRTAEKKLAASA